MDDFAQPQQKFAAADENFDFVITSNFYPVNNFFFNMQKKCWKIGLNPIFSEYFHILNKNKNRTHIKNLSAYKPK